MIVKELEIEFDEGRPIAAVIQEVSDMLRGKIGRRFFDSGVKLIDGAQNGVTVATRDRDTVLRFVGNDDVAVLTVRAPKGELDLHTGAQMSAQAASA